MATSGSVYVKIESFRKWYFTRGNDDRHTFLDLGREIERDNEAFRLQHSVNFKSSKHGWLCNPEITGSFLYSIVLACVPGTDSISVYWWRCRSARSLWRASMAYLILALLIYVSSVLLLYKSTTIYLSFYTYPSLSFSLSLSVSLMWRWTFLFSHGQMGNTKLPDAAEEACSEEGAKRRHKSRHQVEDCCQRHGRQQCPPPADSIRHAAPQERACRQSGERHDSYGKQN